MITAKIIADSIGEYSPRLTTIQITFPRFILAEFNTHRVFSRNFRSSRAVPVKKLIEEVRNKPYEPLVWLKNKPGMQGGESMTTNEINYARSIWLQGAKNSADIAEQLASCNLHKQWANRGLEPYLYVHGVVTATEWSNFFALRCHPDAQPEMRALADAIFIAMTGSEPQYLDIDQWHLPYVNIEDIVKFGGTRPFGPDWPPRKMSVARCARVSYLTQEGKPPKVEDDLALYDRLVGSTPIHASPCEHQATPDPKILTEWGMDWEKPKLHGNLRGWRQHRKFLPGESQ